MTPIEYCRAVRLARARELLEGGDASQKQIAQSLGYKRRGFICTCISQGRRLGAGSLPQTVWPLTTSRQPISQRNHFVAHTGH